MSLLRFLCPLPRCDIFGIFQLVARSLWATRCLEDHHDRLRLSHIEGWRSAHSDDPGTACHGGPGKFARALIHHVFTENLMGHSLLGNNTTNRQKEALGLIRVNAVIGFTCHKFPGTNMAYIKNTLASLLARDLKCPEELKSVDSSSVVHLQPSTFFYYYVSSHLKSPGWMVQTQVLCCD
ncbi:uncharacterized protein LOC125945993 isoform X2 [Dermacentor silvarum]|uniref:uncharacterized protein LOC125945993 isoform X2 n=1 Tax=Dermacentor silvarum TaxID=543639 RepID=UPI002100A71C|nr:uncharacterized protein LOC125945993 isoform X2 [Dermacentor silvarum]